MPTQRAIEIANAFTKYTTNGNKSLIEDFTREEIETTLLQYHLDRGWAHYIAMEKRVEELKDRERENRMDRTKWKEPQVIVGIIAIFIMIGFGIFNMAKKPPEDNSQNMPEIETGDKSPAVQARDDSIVQINYYDHGSEELEKLMDKNVELKEELQRIKGSATLFPERPKVIIANPSVTITNWKYGSTVYGEFLKDGAITAGFDIKFLNIGQPDANNINMKWAILDNGNRITGINEWREFVKEPPLVIPKLQQNRMTEVLYGPHIGSAGVGTLELTIDFQYTDAEGELYSEQYKGYVDYRTVKDGEPKYYLLTPQED